MLILSKHSHNKRDPYLLCRIKIKTLKGSNFHMDQSLSDYVFAVDYGMMLRNMA